MTNTVTIDQWTGDVSFTAEATASDGRFLSLYVGPLPACPWNRWAYTVDTCENAGEHELRPVAMGIAFDKDEAIAAVEEAARHWLRPTPRLEAIT